MRIRYIYACLIALLSHQGLAIEGSGNGENSFTEAEKIFALKVSPILSGKCHACHGSDPDKIKGGFMTTSRESMMAGGDTRSDILVPGSPDESFLITAVKWLHPDYEMPPKENDRLTPEQIEYLEKWISLGAPWVDDGMRAVITRIERSERINEDGEIVETSGGQGEDWTYRRYNPDDLWALRPLLRPVVPKTVSGGSHPVDAFIGQAQENNGLSPSYEATPDMLIRRAYFNLTGLPPTIEDIRDFQESWNRNSEEAWEQLIDRLLESPHYGEQWAQHWLDVVRYSDTGGMANDFERSNMWRYRDYVIRSFNEDKPYDVFVSEQLAGDEMAERAALERLGGDEKALSWIRQSGEFTQEEAEMVVGSSYLRLGPWDNAMITTEEARQIYLDDLVNNVGQTFLATTMRCVKCHDHKFDPVPTRDYYRLYAAFAGTQMAERPLRFLDEENRGHFDSNREFVEKMLRFARHEKDQLVEKSESAAREWYQANGLPYKDENGRRNDPDEMKPPRHVGLNHIEQGQLKVREQDEWIWNRRLERFEPMVNGVYNGPDFRLAWNGARKLRMPKEWDSEWMPVSYIYNGGSLAAPGEKVQPGVLSAVGLPVPSDPRHDRDPYLLTDSLNGRRLGLARWIASPENPLAIRAIVNRVWQHHFGRPLAGNPNNFGAKGGRPTHPELLDFLAAEFIDGGMKFKQLHKFIMMSETYRVGASHPVGERIQEMDPENQYLTQFPTRRLSAEEMRDSMLAMTGELNREMGGLPVNPQINMEVALQPRMIQFSLAPAYQPSQKPEDRNRRSIYAYKVRGLPDPFLEVFDKPGSNESCERRGSSAVIPQALTLFNSDVVSARSIALAARVTEETADKSQWVGRAFELILGRLPAPDETERLKTYLTRMEKYHRDHKTQKVSWPSSITRSLVEEFSGRSFEYTEILPVFEDYNGDKQPADVTAETRALADICLILFNSHEFSYIY